METLANLESFVRSAEAGSFSLAARRLGLTPAAVSRNVAQLERNLGVRLFQRSTRGLTTTETGDRFLLSLRSGLDDIQTAIADVTRNAGQPAGTLKLTAPAGFGVTYLLPLMPAFRERYPAVVLDWSFDNRPVDLIAGGFDVAIGGGFDLPDGMVARELARITLIAVGAPDLLRDRTLPSTPSELAQWPCVSMRSPLNNRVRTWVMRQGMKEMTAEETPVMIANDPDALCSAVVVGIGIGLVAVPLAKPYLESGALVRLLPEWHVEVGPMSLYYTGLKLLPAKTRAFIDFVSDAFKAPKFRQLFALEPGASDNGGR
ncbi:LysR family transcriptional regulator [Xanthomonas arboricola]|uniref:HTH-type transcriptional regulator PgrR n=1 Tax=Xanthomonas arboricola pv. corylina TaxID=487821 RepID=A0ABN7M1W0_9XANT|nr:LysR family transcriptional regulator [Xanthomonas arboricola]MDN0209264.1 LysR family transcriptional regulator [Xanthomonas arboricola pv. corylina]MDN0213651.1 LysR family transcriptional regulator [Xanthomonas arboricola pv. corylina]QUI82633.1 LysR family transcriptional regulator [Xanthomonas arboricola pv. corylina]UQQ12699.1 LysR family transcriptional regulator [Xanthomonas arboricola pv. corylina]WIX25312.1 LysR family transcriptional regulator [Xanthomonas arboricola pv. corylina